jgi:hypothetical protein
MKGIQTEYDLDAHPGKSLDGVLIPPDKFHTDVKQYHNFRLLQY